MDYTTIPLEVSSLNIKKNVYITSLLEVLTWVKPLLRWCSYLVVISQPSGKYYLVKTRTLLGYAYSSKNGFLFTVIMEYSKLTLIKR